ncbi:MAG: hypothetical protein IT319_00485 [Anaerolineae bacterium]|nr:hypothetical protein [Anaerolineae bacterium]
MKTKLGLVIVSLIAVLATVGVVGAQDAGQPSAPPDRPGMGQRGDRLQNRFQVLGDLAQIVADDLGIERAELVQQLREQTLEEVITAMGGDIDQITADVTAALTERVNQAVADGKLAQERADAILASLDDVVQRALSGELRGVLRDSIGRLGRGDRLPLVQRPFLNDTRPLINAASDAIGLTGQEIAQALRDGKTLSEVITENGGSPDAIVASAIALVKETLDPAVANGRLTQEQEDAMLSGLEAFYDAVMNGAFRTEASASV